MLIIKTEQWPGGNEKAAKEVGRLKVISQNPFDLTGNQISSYTYEMADPGTAAFPLKGTGQVHSHFRQQPVWMLVEQVLRDMAERGLLMHQQTGGPDREDKSQTLAVKVEIWESGYDKNAVEIGRIRIVSDEDSHAVEVMDPVTSNLALRGSCSVVGEFHRQPVWALVHKVMADMHARGILATPNDGSYGAVGRAWLELALRDPTGQNATTHFIAALNAYAFAFQNSVQLTAGLHEVLETLLAARPHIEARSDKGIDSRYAFVIKHGLDLCGADDALKPQLEALHAAQKAAYLASKGPGGFRGFLRKFLAVTAD